MAYLKNNDMPKNSKGEITKLALKTALKKQEVLIFEKDNNTCSSYKKIEASAILNMWGGFRYAPKYQSLEEEASACIGTSYYYKFSLNKK